MQMLPKVLNTVRFGAVTEEPRHLGKSDVEPVYVQSDMKYPDTSSGSNRA